LVDGVGMHSSRPGGDRPSRRHFNPGSTMTDG
jgi:hypothetical protein